MALESAEKPGERLSARRAQAYNRTQAFQEDVDSQESAERLCEAEWRGER